MSVDADLATLRRRITNYASVAQDHEGFAALARVQAELSRLREQVDRQKDAVDHHEAEADRLREQRDALEAGRMDLIDRAASAEARCARLQQALREIAQRGEYFTSQGARHPQNASVLAHLAREALAGPDTPDNRQRFEFDTSEIPPDATVTAATLRLTPDTTADSQGFTPSRAPVDPPIVLPADSQEDKT